MQLATDLAVEEFNINDHLFKITLSTDYSLSIVSARLCDWQKSAVLSYTTFYVIVWTELTGEENLGIECLRTVNGTEYIGTANRTLSGKQCQAWNSQSPHIHSYDDLSYFPDKATSIDNIYNYCRNLQLDAGSYDVLPWCMPMSNVLSKEYCNIPICKGNLTTKLFALRRMSHFIFPMSYS
jgi:Kringle domain